MAHFHPSSSRSTTYRTPPNTAATDSSRRSRETTYRGHDLYEDPSEETTPGTGYPSGVRSGRYPGTPRTYRSAHDHGYSEDEEDEPSESEPMNSRPYAHPTGTNVRRLPLIGQTMSLGYGGTRSHSDPNGPQPQLGHRRARPMSDNFSASVAGPYVRYGHVPPSPTPRSPTELHMYSDPLYPNQLPPNTSAGLHSGNYNTHSLPPVQGYPHARPAVYQQPARVIHGQPGGIPLSDSDTETDGVDGRERWGMV